MLHGLIGGPVLPGTQMDMPESAATHWDPSSKYGQPGSPSTYAGLADGGVDVNPSYNDASGNGKMNCQRTATTFEMRARGYDVTAPPAVGGDGNVRNIESMWENDKGQHTMFTVLPRTTTEEAVASVDGQPGMRYIVIGRNATGMGHAWNAEVQPDGSVMQWDPQAGRMIVPDSWGMDRINVLRVDDLNPTTTMAYDGGKRMPPWVMATQEYNWAYPEASRQ